ncbi:hypothetical protein JW826_05790 [Candidatus Woesearchaeota archaeon]|nr:hypothetical protein [Candidatus Woesearchaeota archaeon]
MGLLSWLWRLLFGDDHLNREAGANDSINMNASALRAVPGAIRGIVKRVYKFMRSDAKIAKRALKKLRGLKEDIVAYFNDYNKFSSEAFRLRQEMSHESEPVAIKKYEGLIQDKQKLIDNCRKHAASDFKSFVGYYDLFVRKTNDILFKQKELLSFDNKALTGIFVKIRDGFASALNSPISEKEPAIDPRIIEEKKKELVTIRDELARIIMNEMRLANVETSEDNRFRTSQVAKVGFWGWLMPQSHFINKAKKDMKRWEKSELQEQNADEIVLKALANKDVPGVISGLRTHLDRFRLAVGYLEQLSKDDQVALEEAIQMGNTIKNVLVQRDTMGFLPDNTLRNRFLLMHRTAENVMTRDVLNSRQLAGLVRTELFNLRIITNQVYAELEQFKWRAAKRARKASAARQ